MARACYDEAITLHRAHDGPGSLDFANAARRVAILNDQQGERSSALGMWRETRELHLAVERASGHDMSEGLDECDANIARLETKGLT